MILGRGRHPPSLSHWPLGRVSSAICWLGSFCMTREHTHACMHDSLQLHGVRRVNGYLFSCWQHAWRQGTICTRTFVASFASVLYFLYLSVMVPLALGPEVAPGPRPTSAMWMLLSHYLDVMTCFRGPAISCNG